MAMTSIFKNSGTGHILPVPKVGLTVWVGGHTHPGPPEIVCLDLGEVSYTTN
jgi:hypothetical protein